MGCLLSVVSATLATTNKRARDENDDYDSTSVSTVVVNDSNSDSNSNKKKKRKDVQLQSSYLKDNGHPKDNGYPKDNVATASSLISVYSPNHLKHPLIAQTGAPKIPPSYSLSPWQKMFDDVPVLVCSVHDGDTFTFVSAVDGVHEFKYSVRLARIDAPEIRTHDAEEKQRATAAKLYLESRLLGQIVMLRHCQSDKYGRILADVYVRNTNTSPTFSECVNDTMVRLNHARFYDGKHKDPWVFTSPNTTATTSSEEEWVTVSS